MQAECWEPSTVHKLSIPAMYWHLEWFTTLPIPKVHNSTTLDKLSMQFELLVSLGHRNHPTLDFHLDGIEEQIRKGSNNHLWGKFHFLAHRHRKEWGVLRQRNTREHGLPAWSLILPPSDSYQQLNIRHQQQLESMSNALHGKNLGKFPINRFCTSGSKTSSHSK